MKGKKTEFIRSRLPGKIRVRGVFHIYWDKARAGWSLVATKVPTKDVGQLSLITDPAKETSIIRVAFLKLRNVTGNGLSGVDGATIRIYGEVTISRSGRTATLFSFK